MILSYSLYESLFSSSICLFHLICSVIYVSLYSQLFCLFSLQISTIFSSSIKDKYLKCDDWCFDITAPKVYPIFCLLRENDQILNGIWKIGTENNVYMYNLMRRSGVICAVYIWHLEQNRKKQKKGVNVRFVWKIRAIS